MPLQNIIWTNIQPVQATNYNNLILWNIIPRWSIYGEHYCNRPLHVPPAPIILYPAHPINRDRKVRRIESLRRSRNYHAHRRIQNRKSKHLTSQSQFIPWDKDDIIKGKLHTVAPTCSNGEQRLRLPYQQVRSPLGPQFTSSRKFHHGKF